MNGSGYSGASQFSNIQNPNFTSELCSFLSNLAKTPEEQYQGLNLDLSRLKEALLQEVETVSETRSKRSSESSNDGMDSASSASPSSSFNSAQNSDKTNSDFDMSSSSEVSPPRSLSSSYMASRSASNSVSPPSAIVNLHLRSRLRSNDNLTFSTVYFALQRGPRYELVVGKIKRAFESFGRVKRAILYDRPKSGIDGFIDFVEASSAESAMNKNVETEQCHLHVMKDWSMLSEVPEPHQILLESRYLPKVWEKEMVLRSFFTKFGFVTGVVFLGYRGADLQRFVISFRDSQPAQDLIGSSVKILSSTVFIKEVTNKTIRS